MYLVDANILIDLFTDDPQWADWSEQVLTLAAGSGDLWINPIIYAEISIAFIEQQTLDNALRSLNIQRTELPYPVAFLAGKAFLRYRKQGGLKRSPLPDFYIGAHALLEHLKLLTRDPTRYRTYFPELELICPEVE